MFLRLFRHTTLCRNFIKSSKKSIRIIHIVTDTSNSSTTSCIGIIRARNG